MNRQVAKNAANASTYSAANKKIASFSPVEDFWAIYSHLIRSSDLPSSTTYSLFCNRIAPTWERPVHTSGGKLSTYLRKHISSGLWEKILLALVGDAFSEAVGDEVTGVQLSVKAGEDVLSVWN
jgi:translation initiation factor 4E